MLITFKKNHAPIVSTFVAYLHHCLSEKETKAWWRGYCTIMAPTVTNEKKLDARGHRQLAEFCYRQGTPAASWALAAASWCDEIARVFFVGYFHIAMDKLPMYLRHTYIYICVVCFFLI